MRDVLNVGMLYIEENFECAGSFVRKRFECGDIFSM